MAPKKVLAEVDLTAIAVPVADKPRGRKRKSQDPPTPPPEVVAHAQKETLKQVAPEIVSDTISVKKPRTEKQLAADAKRREAAAQKKADKEAEDARIKAEEVRRFKEAEAKKAEQAAKRKAAREAKKAAAAEASEEDDEPKPQLPIAASVPLEKPKKTPRPKQVEFTQVKQKAPALPRPVAEDPRNEALLEIDAARKQRMMDQQRKRAALYGSSQQPKRQRMR